MSPSEIAEKLKVPTVYVEEEPEILCKGENGEYGRLRRLDNGNMHFFSISHGLRNGYYNLEGMQ